MSGTKLPIMRKLQAKHGLYNPKSKFTHIVATQGDTEDVWSHHISKVGDLVKEQENWIKGLEIQKEYRQRKPQKKR